MRRLLLGWILLLIGIGCLTQSQAFWQSRDSNYNKTSSGYQGPGDIVSGASAWYAVNQCYNTAYAGNVADVWDSATGNTTETLIKCTAGGTLSFTINPIATTCAVSCSIKILYDQTGSLACTGAACDVSALLANRPTYTQNALNSKACGTWGASIALNTQANNLTSIAQQFSFVSVVNRTGNLTTVNRVLETTGGPNTRLGFSNATNTASIFAGSSFTAAANDNAFHALTTVFNNASSSIVVDGSATAGTAGAQVAATTIEIGNEGISNSNLFGLFCEGGIWPVGLNATQYGNLNSNMHTRWNF